MKKRFGSILCLIVVFMIVASTSLSFAATPRAYCPLNQKVGICPVIGYGEPQNVRLNIATDLSQSSAMNNLANNTNVNLYSPTGHWSQYWYFTNQNRSDGYYMLQNYYVTNQALNVSFFSSSYLNCDVVRWQNNMTDSAVGSGGAVYFGFQLQNYQQYHLAATGTAS